MNIKNFIVQGAIDHFEQLKASGFIPTLKACFFEPLDNNSSLKLGEVVGDVDSKNYDEERNLHINSLITDLIQTKHEVVFSELAEADNRDIVDMSNISDYKNRLKIFIQGKISKYYLDDKLLVEVVDADPLIYSMLEFTYTFHYR